MSESIESTKKVPKPKATKSKEPKEPKEPKKPKEPKAEKPEPELCSICADHYTPILRKKVVCKFCSKDTCCKCIEQYLLNRHEDAHCLHCRVNYSDQVLREICTKTYLTQVYFKHRQEVLINRERVQLPPLQDEAIRARTLRQGYKDLRVLADQKKKLEKELNIASHATYRLRVRLAKLRQEPTTPEELAEVERQLVLSVQTEREIIDRRYDIKKAGQDLRNRLWRIRYRRNPETGEREDGDGGDEKEEKEEKRKFIRRCMRPNCTGFLSTAWKCGICEWYSCSKCFSVRGEHHDSPHECKKEDIETADLIRSQSKPCPKCGEFIEKSSGCFAKDTPILCMTLGGPIKKAQDIVVGDALVGEDGVKRTVLALTQGVDEMYEVIQSNGMMSYTVNSKHTLLLRNEADEDIEMLVDAYMALSEEEKAGLYGWKAYAPHRVPIRVEPRGRGEYYGWMIDGNHRFILPDMTVVKNCNQMYCISCHTPWDWVTGKIVTHGVIHNPHYYEWLKRTGGAVQRNPADVPCGGYPNAWDLLQLSVLLPKKLTRFWREFHRLCMEVQDQSQRNYRSHLDQQSTQAIHVNYLLGDYTDARWGQLLAINEKKKKRDAEIQDVFNAFRMVAVELINRIQNYREKGQTSFTYVPLREATPYLEGVVEEMKALIQMINDAFKAISISHSYSVPWIGYIHINPDGSATTLALRAKNWSTAKRGKKKGGAQEEEKQGEHVCAAAANTVNMMDEDSEDEPEEEPELQPSEDAFLVPALMEPEPESEEDDEIIQMQRAIAESLIKP